MTTLRQRYLTSRPKYNQNLTLLQRRVPAGIVVNDGEERTGNISQKKVRYFTIAYRYPLSDKCCRREYFFSNQWNIYWESLGKHSFSCDFFTTK